MDSRRTLLQKLAPVAFAVALSAGGAGTAFASNPPDGERIDQPGSGR